jgi:hypothetical protein
VAPNFLSGALRVFAKMLVAFFDVSIDGFSSCHWRRVIAVVNDGSRHTAKHRLDHIQELRSCREAASF